MRMIGWKYRITWLVHARRCSVSTGGTHHWTIYASQSRDDVQWGRLVMTWSVCIQHVLKTIVSKKWLVNNTFPRCTLITFLSRHNFPDIFCIYRLYISTRKTRYISSGDVESTKKVQKSIWCARRSESSIYLKCWLLLGAHIRNFRGNCYHVSRHSVFACMTCIKILKN